MLNIKKELKELYESGQDIYTFEHSLVFKNTDSGEITVVNDNIKKITNDFKIDGTPIGKFPIEIIEFEIGGDYTEKFKMDNSYEVHIIDKYVSPTINDEITSKTFVITEMEYSRENRSTSFKGYDYGSKLSVEYDDTKYKLPLTLGQFATKFFAEYGLEIENINDMFQKDYQLKVIPTYDTGVMGIQVARDIAKMSMSIIYMGQNNKIKIIDPTKNVDVNLCKQDFSDFTNFQESKVTIKKTFPLWHFNGGKNLYIGGFERKFNLTATQTHIDIGTMFELEPNKEYTFSFELENKSQTTLPLIIDIGLGTGGNYRKDLVGAFLIINKERQSYTFTLSQSDFDAGLKYFSWRIRNRNQEMEVLQSKLALIVGKQVEYTPAPEDGYNYQGIDCSYHIQTTGGINVMKMLRSLGNVDGIFRTSVRVLSFNENLIVRLNGVDDIHRIKKGVLSNPQIVDERLSGFRNLNFTSTAVDKDLDFIASSPQFFKDNSIGSIDTYKSFKSNQDMFKTLGVNRLTLGLSGDIDGENVSKSDSSMIDVDGEVELRLDSIPFVFDQALKQEVINNMFNHIKGFKYRAFESESKFFFYEIGDYIKQVGNDEVGGDYNILLVQQTIVRNGSTMTTHSAESGSVNETQMNWENYTPSKHSEIMINKALQEIVLINNNYNGLKDQVSELKVNLDEISASVSTMGGNNVIYGLNLENDFIDWRTTNTTGLKMGDKKRFYDGMTFGMKAIVEDIQSLSGRALVALYAGNMITPKGRIIPDSKYSYRGKRWSGTQNFSITVIEYNSSLSVVKRTKFDFTSPKEYESFTMQPNNSTMWIELEFTFVNVAPTNPLKLTDQMFARGEPKAYVENVGDLRSWAMAEFKVQDDLISSKVDVDGVISTINQSAEEVAIKAEKISLEGIVTANGNVKIFEDGSIEVLNGKFRGTIDTDKDAQVGERIGFPILRPNNVSELVQMTKAGKGGLYWGFDPDVYGARARMVYHDMADLIIGKGRLTIGSDGDINVNSNGKLDLRANGPYPASLDLDPDAGTLNAYFGKYAHIKANDLIRLITINSSSETKGIQIDSNDAITPLSPSANTSSLGTASARFSYLYLKNQPNVASDTRYKLDVQDICPIMIKHFDAIEPQMYKTQFDDKIHFGYIAQDVERAIYKYSLEKYGYEVAKTFGKEFAVLSKDESYMSLLYGEIQVIKDAINKFKFKELDDRLKKVEEILNGNI